MKETEQSTLRLHAAINRRYADACEETFVRTGQAGALYMAEVHRTCAAQKEARAVEAN